MQPINKHWYIFLVIVDSEANSDSEYTPDQHTQPEASTSMRTADKGVDTKIAIMPVILQAAVRLALFKKYKNTTVRQIINI